MIIKTERARLTSMMLKTIRKAILNRKLLSKITLMFFCFAFSEWL